MGGATYTLGTLSIGADTLTVNAGTNVTSGTAGVTFGGTTTFSGAPTLNLADPTNGGSTLLTVGTVSNGGNTATFTGSADFAQTGVWGNGSGGVKLGSGAGAGYTGIVTLSQPNTFTGATTIDDGTLYISADNNLGTAPGSATANSLIINGGTLATTATFPLNANRGGSVGSSAGTIDVASGTTLTYNGIIANVSGQTGALTKTDSGTLVLGGNSTFTGTTTISGGTLQLDGTGTSPNSPLGTAASSAIVSSGGTLDLNGFTLAIAKPLTLNGAGFNAEGALINSSATAATYSGLVTLGSSSSIVATNGNIYLTATGTITGTGFGLTLGGAANGSNNLVPPTSGSYLASIIGTGTTGSLTMVGTGTWTLTGASTYGAPP